MCPSVPWDSHKRNCPWNENVLVALARRCTTFLGVAFASAPLLTGAAARPHSPGWGKAKEGRKRKHLEKQFYMILVQYVVQQGTGKNGDL